MRISRSLTIKQMAMISAVAVVFIFVFISILLFHFMQQYNYNTAMQMESIARAVRQPLAAAVLKGDIPAAQAILQHINPAGIIGHADVVLPDQFQALRVTFGEQQPIPLIVARLFAIPQQISLPLYALRRPANPQPLAYLVLRADGWQAYRYVISMFSTLIASWLLLSLMLSIAISWCINRLIVHPLRNLAAQFEQIASNPDQQLQLPPLHHDDEIGVMVRTCNQQQQRVHRYYQQKIALATLPKKLRLREDSPNSMAALLLIHCATLNDASLNATQKHTLLLALAEKLAAALPAGMPVAQVDNASFLLAVQGGAQQPGDLVELIGQLHSALNDLHPLYPLPCRATVSISSATASPVAESSQRYQHTLYIAHSSPHPGQPVSVSFEIQKLCPPGSEADISEENAREADREANQRSSPHSHNS